MMEAMRNGLRLCLATGLALIGVTTAVSSASAAEHLLTLYSPPIVTEPYVHTTHYIHLAADGREAPATPGYITGWKEQVLVDSTDPQAKPLSNARFMIHHFVIFAPQREHQLDGGCWGQLGFIGGRGEEHP